MQSNRKSASGISGEDCASPDPETDGAWRQEIRRRMAEIESGREAGVHGDEVSAEIRKIVGR